MGVYKKLQDARIKLLNTKLTKTGKNKFANYEYFQLDDFLPAIQKICQEVGICGTVHFQEELAALIITDVEDGSFINFSCQMSTAELKGMHPVQNLGAVITYTRRYLWTNAFEITEHDPIDASEPITKKVPDPIVANSHDELRDSLDEQLKKCNTIEEVADIFRVNRQALDAVKAVSKVAYDNMMISFSVRKNILTKE